ncbi:uncharacterized protein LOC129716673 [Wyeomyia smithii]|uniref:uncharacterized protein LOC129716673 n=1 Tax=Wyeomyia smithii TaxID=174621 RepID=UPI002468137C|nr:uncharacterized protein LOC129716673 [Wyeomyia smithii]
MCWSTILFLTRFLESASFCVVADGKNILIEFSKYYGNDGRTALSGKLAVRSRSSKKSRSTHFGNGDAYRGYKVDVEEDRLTSELPLRPVDITTWPIPESIKLADPQFHHPGKISILLGNKLFFSLIEPGTIKLSANDSLPVLQNTKLGWVVSGGYKEAESSLNSSVSPCLVIATNDVLSQQISRFWELEEYINPKPHMSDQELLCEDHFLKYTTRDSLGRFIVRLPFLKNPATLGNSREIAIRRLLHLEQKLDKNILLKQQYHEFMREYIQLGHMLVATNASSKLAIFLPHHCVVKEASTTTKCRVVFDASAKTSSGESLNDVLMVGPVLQDSLIDILLRFRYPTVVLTADIQKMYRMVQLHEDDRNFQRILWRWTKEESICEYRLSTVTYGTKSASYLATKCTVEKAVRGIYVDDVITGADTLDEAIILRSQLSSLFGSGGFHLRKWASNCASALTGVPKADIELKVPIELDESDTIKTLGIHWQPCSDELRFSYHPTQILQPTKRSILSQIASLFDPLGLLTPIVIKAKFIMQRLWELKVAWDASPPGELVNAWYDLLQSLSSLNSFQIPRRVVSTRSTSHLVLHGYSDASERAMGACVHVRTINGFDTIASHLLCAKSKLAPIGNKRTTLLRLELVAMRILARLIKNVTAAVEQPFYEIRAWTDSQVALAWINGGASRWKTFVANRVAEIVTHLPAINWGHIDTHLNPADLISRGVVPEKLKDCSLW